MGVGTSLTPFPGRGFRFVVSVLLLNDNLSVLDSDATQWLRQPGDVESSPVQADVLVCIAAHTCSPGDLDQRSLAT